VPYAESVGTLKELLDEGKIRLAGISNATIDQIDIARKIPGDQSLTSVQNQFSPAFRSSQDELAHCAELGIAFLPFSPLGASRPESITDSAQAADLSLTPPN
jgi:aryl-alcohol dehydrogenase-like predicted oxidoreductase